MNEKTLEQLDYFKIRDEVAACCMSSESKNTLSRRLPFTKKELIDTLKKQAAQWKLFLDSGKENPLSAWNELQPILSLLEVEGSVIAQEDAYSLAVFCQITEKIKKTFSLVRGSLDISELCFLSDKIPDLTPVSEKIFRIIDSSGQIKDLPEIRAIRRSILQIRKDIENLMKHYSSDMQFKDVLQSDVPALRSDRQVLAVKANFKGRIKGIVHEVSQTGQTVYIEPDDVVQKNNDLIQEEFRLSQEIRRILKELTDSLREYSGSIGFAQKMMIRLDCAYAAARWGQQCSGIFALDCSDTVPLTLVQARHPLLGESAVPIDVRYINDCRVLIVTGPNTGGKTVTLKTIALFALLNQAGFPIPAAEGTALPIFAQFYADIGDEQSMEQSLSTFSGHMKNVAKMVTSAGEKSLVILDELGSGTDPLEGGAIAMAVLDELIARKAFVLVTTHHGILKNYGFSHPSCMNASVDFDENTLSPTYRIIMGVPGESHALDIAQKSGLPKKIVQKAKNYMVNEKADVSVLIKGLTSKHEELSRREKQIAQESSALQAKVRKVDLKDLRIKQKELELREMGHRQSKQFLEESRKKLENLVRTLREGEITREKTLAVKQLIAELTDEVEREEEILAAEQEKIDSVQQAIPMDEIPEVKVIQTGMDVFVGKSRSKGFVVDSPKKGFWNVTVGSMKMLVKEADIIIAPQQKSPSVSVEIAKDSGIIQDGRITYVTSQEENPVFELRLLGMRYEAAMKALERQLDLASLKNFKTFSVIHGKGNGILQQGVHDYLSHYPGVKEFHFARPEDGGTGKTYVTLE